MNRSLQFLCRLYGMGLNLFPKKYREEYGAELQAVFGLSLDDAAQKGRFEIEKLVIRELISLPKAVILEHLRQRRRSKMAGKLASRFDFTPGSRTEIWAALAPFLFGMVMNFLAYIDRSITVPVWIQIAIVLFFWSSVLVLFLVRSTKGMPRWFLPYLGLPLP